MMVKSLVSMNSRAPAIVVKPARTMNWPDGDQNRWLQAFFSNLSIKEDDEKWLKNVRKAKIDNYVLDPNSIYV